MIKKLSPTNKRSGWKWFGVKLLFECQVSGEPLPEKIDDEYSNEFKSFEESIVLIRAQSFDQAYKIAEKKAKERELSYENPYDQTVNWKLIESLDAFWLFDDDLESGTELYSRFIDAPKELDNEIIMDILYPETIGYENEQPGNEWMTRILELSKKFK